MSTFEGRRDLGLCLNVKLDLHEKNYCSFSRRAISLPGQNSHL